MFFSSVYWLCELFLRLKVVTTSRRSFESLPALSLTCSTLLSGALLPSTPAEHSCPALLPRSDTPLHRTPCAVLPLQLRAGHCTPFTDLHCKPPPLRTSAARLQGTPLPPLSLPSSRPLRRLSDLSAVYYLPPRATPAAGGVDTLRSGLPRPCGSGAGVSAELRTAQWVDKTGCWSTHCAVCWRAVARLLRIECRARWWSCSGGCSGHFGGNSTAHLMCLR